MEELRKFESSNFDTHAKLIEDQNIIMELSGRLQELQKEVNCMNNSKNFHDAESVRSGNSHVTSQPRVFPKHRIPEGLLRPSFVSPRRKEGLPDIWDTPGISGNIFANPRASSAPPCPRELKPWGKIVGVPLRVSTAEKRESMEKNYQGTKPHVYCREKWRTKARLRSEMPVWTVSQKFSHLQWRRLFKELWSRPTTTADFGPSL